MAAVEHIPLVGGSESETSEKRIQHERKRRQRKQYRRRQQRAPTGEDSSPEVESNIRTAETLEMQDLPVRIEIRRCSQAPRPSTLPVSEHHYNFHSNPDLLERSQSEQYTQGLSRGSYLQVGTPPEPRRSLSVDQQHHSRSKSCRAPSKSAYLSIPGQKPRCRSQGQIDVDEGPREYYRLRHFSITGQGIVNRGDSFRCRTSRSCTSVASDCTEYSGGSSRGRFSLICGSREQDSVASSVPSSGMELGRPKPYLGLVLGAPGVGKTSLVHQFMTSEYVNAYEIGSIDEDGADKSVSILLDGQESELHFADPTDDDSTLEEQIDKFKPDAFIVIYSVIDPDSVCYAENIVQTLWKLSVVGNKAVILVASKTDLVRSRRISQGAGRKLACTYDCKFIEVSGGLDHRVDELLVGILSQIRLKEQTRLSRSRSLVRRSSRLSRSAVHSSSFKGLLNVVCGTESKSKSCENLQEP